MEMEMEMEMEMDMDELELLEANYSLYEQDFTEHQPSPPPEKEHDTCPRSPPSTHSTEKTESDGHKRLRAPDEAQASAEKRSRIDDDEDDWLRHSPPPHQSEAPILEETSAPAPIIQEKLVSRYASEIDGDFIPVTAPGSGDRVYAKISRAEMEQPAQRGLSRSSGAGLISESIDVLLHRIEQEAFTKALQTSSRDPNDVVLPETTVVHERLWVDKYAPHSFTELLSDEQTNREVLLWLKQWDSCVFGSEIRSTTDEVMTALKRHKIPESKFPRSNRGSRWNNDKFKHMHANGRNFEDNKPKTIEDFPKKTRSTGPPENKILLLCGPPGLGKTTLAHIAAKHCGYRVVEVNASDERSSSAIGAKILDVVQMNSVSADCRPKCLVIDEIDGALGDGKGAVEVILKMVSADKKSDIEKDKIDKENTSGKASSKKGSKSAALTRPIICICNDLYAPSLRPLRQIAKVHVFVQPTVNRVVSRLKYICDKEGMKTGSIGLTLLAEHTECDIRSCLNTLQFLNKRKEALKALDIGSQVVGRKDMSVGVFDVWKEIFQKRKPKRQQSVDTSCGIMSNESGSLYSLVSHRGDYDLIVDGLHENLLHLPYHDPIMQKTVKCLDSLGVYDLMNKYIMRTQHMNLYAYQPVIAIIVHHLVAQVERPNIEWPKSFYRYRTTLMEKVDSLRSWYHTIPASISRHLSIKSFVEDSISLLLHILSPPSLRLAALHLLSEKEKNDLTQLVGTMVSYSITHRRIKSDTLPGNFGYQAADVPELSFDPPINNFINFQGYKAGHYVLASTMKQMLAHEVEKQRILQASIGKSEQMTHATKKENDASLGLESTGLQSSRAGHLGASPSNNGKSENMSNRTQLNSSASGVLPNLGTGNNPAMTKVNSSGCIRKSSGGSSSFFDRFRKLGKGSQNTADAVRKEATSERDSRPLVFKFNEGFTNAVKRPVRVREFLS